MYSTLERFRIAARGGKPDRVPVAFLAGGDFISWFAGYSTANSIEYWKGDYETKLAAQISLVKTFKDAIFWPGIWPDYGPVVEASALGCDVIFPQDSSPHILTSSLKRLDAVEQLEAPDPRHDGLMPKVLEGYEYMKEKIPKELSESHGYLDGIAFSMGPADIAALVVGYEQLVLAIAEYPDAAEKLMKVTTRTVIDWIAAQLDVTGEPRLVIVMDDAIGLIKQSSFDKLYLRHINRVYDTYRQTDAVLLFHNCGNVAHLVDRLGEIKATSFNYGPEMGTAKMKAKLEKRMSLLGGLSPWGPLLTGKSPEVEADCSRAIREGSKDGGFTLCTEGSLGVGTHKENIYAAIAAAEKYGKYC